ncbi:MAG: hypothetical protein AAF628_35425 [Planctomycetota bacterium]
MRTRFAKDYVVVMLDVERMTDGAALAEELRQGDGGIPWLVILDGDGKAKVTSDGPDGNVGCPAQPAEIDYFMTMLDTTRRHMTDDDRAILEREMRSYGAELTRPRRDAPGGRAYPLAATAVKDGAFSAALAHLEEALQEELPPHAILANPALRLLREDPDHRIQLQALLREYAQPEPVVMVDPFEPGQRLRLVGRVVDHTAGTPLAGALVHLFHTDASGEYRPGMDAGGGAGNPRLFGFVRTDDQGAFAVDTIYPERYPNSAVPRHVHYRVLAEGYPELVSECFFDADPLLSESTRRSAPERNFPIVVLEQDEAHRTVAPLTIRVPQE